MKGIYIHIPFCLNKCKYCDFASYPAAMGMQDEYINALVEDITKLSGERVDTLYIGGGTPSVLSGTNIQKLLYAINENLDIDANSEFTIEVNPATVDGEKAKLFKTYGVNRISMGVQSFCDNELSLLGRIHTSADAESTYHLLRSCGFENISMDLMYALPNQTLSTLSASVEKILSLNPEHVSCYGLKFEEGTPFYDELTKGILKECDEDTFADMYHYIREALSALGYKHYEISNFAKPQRESRHNLKYWQNGDYIGIGVAASSKVGAQRCTYTKSIEEYIKSRKLAENYTMSQREQMQEFIILGLRVIKTGVDKAQFRNLFGVSVDDVFADAIHKVEPYIINTPDAIKLRNDALLVSNSIMCEFMD